jgi:hypothetical protein
MTSNAFFILNVSREIISPEITSGNWKSGAWVPKANMVEGVNTII